MTRRSRALRKVRLGVDAQSPPVSKVRGPADVAVMIPYLLGFQPIESLVLVALEGPRKRFGPVLRVDLVDDPDLQAEQTALVVEVMTNNQVSLVLVAAFSDDPVRAGSVVHLVIERLAERGVALEDAFRADGRRWWSYVCNNPRCCSPDGVPYDPGTSRVAAEAVVSGLSFVADREALRARFAPDDAETRRLVRCAVTALRDGHSVRSFAAADQLAGRISAALGAPSLLAPDDIAWLALAVRSVAMQESALRLVDRSHAAKHFELWLTVTRRVPDDLVPATCSLAAFSAWLDGRGVLASHAIDRVFEVAPDYPAAVFIEDLLARAANPRTWSAGSDLHDNDGSPSPLAG